MANLFFSENNDSENDIFADSFCNVVDELEKMENEQSLISNKSLENEQNIITNESLENERSVANKSCPKVSWQN